MSEVSTIKPGLIIYRSPRHSKFHKNNIKYRLFSNKVTDSSWRDDFKKKKDGLSTSISKITVHLSQNTFKTRNFFRFSQEIAPFGVSISDSIILRNLTIQVEQSYSNRSKRPLFFAQEFRKSTLESCKNPIIPSLFTFSPL